MAKRVFRKAKAAGCALAFPPQGPLFIASLRYALTPDLSHYGRTAAV